mmetsp:Transcript_77552/g.153848  ORF Transcript_77552/g.153848 Transcript_77552/m.153848 type:complete len:200 (+) Transcript_77552:69-668(+)|eukprot:CAMPEP_0172691280 /NCGR_PEP_ID=MMETSP1074-20121228/24430_1 /TAXON_ID=2916 /ORGANISM="Ceratium fusus, Strain PA161109" /LENGTH=199 /DNA_ID=CAMNT_0013511313 /DNA_START=64 /DNA_END=663 /DNA_ORIENTATION=-
MALTFKVRSLGGKEVTIEMDASASVAELHGSIAAALDFPAQQTLVAVTSSRQRLDPASNNNLADLGLPAGGCELDVVVESKVRARRHVYITEVNYSSEDSQGDMQRKIEPWLVSTDEVEMDPSKTMADQLECAIPSQHFDNGELPDLFTMPRPAEGNGAPKKWQWDIGEKVNLDQTALEIFSIDGDRDLVVVVPMGGDD